MGQRNWAFNQTRVKVIRLTRESGQGSNSSGNMILDTETKCVHTSKCGQTWQVEARHCRVGGFLQCMVHEVRTEGVSRDPFDGNKTGRGRLDLDVESDKSHSQFTQVAS